MQPLNPTYKKKQVGKEVGPGDSETAQEHLGPAVNQDWVWRRQEEAAGPGHNWDKLMMARGSQGSITGAELHP